MKFTKHLFLLLLTVSFFSCQPMTLIGTEKGGCNDMQENQIETKRNKTEQDDVVSYTVDQGVLTIHVGVNHICCTPFTTEANVADNKITLKLIDTCPGPDYNCYCRCNCYYTFDFKFKDFSAKEYQYELYLKNARESKPKLIKKGEIDLSK